MSKLFIVETSARHIHLSESDVKVNKERVCCKHALFILNKEKYDYTIKRKSVERWTDHPRRGDLIE